MWCHFVGGNLDQQALDIDEREISEYLGIPMCSPPQDPKLVRSYGMGVYSDTGRTITIDGRLARLFEHYGNWQSVNPPPFAVDVSGQAVTVSGAGEPVPEFWSYADLLGDVSAGDWLRERIPRFGSTVSALVPDVYPTHLRLLHPAWTIREVGLDRSPVRWKILADALGAVMHQTVAWGSMIEAGVRSGRGTGEGSLWDASPTTGELPARETVALATVLAEHTTTPDDCYFGFWEGLGFRGVPENHPRMTLPGRRHLLVRGSVGDAGRELQGFLPSIWWPADRAWFVASDVDLMSTYVGGATELANALHGEIELFEAIDSWLGARITWDCDTINPRASGPHTHD
ncbi:hypothetical protein [Rhodococcoides yunnanense]|uniref:SUKH-4 immunity protein of toxin-antitoxin system n=1 Tax=Rhodococcoides yunnanense TaxID=278209 RepID=A0ABU4B744_9NOCA|nr:hypothetical protein [Rhodococcus yunnanensis]MDV6260015.1 hypothetical protein [Rhodococcus yunnanensis]